MKAVVGVPEGFLAFSPTGFIAHNGPFYRRTRGDGVEEFGFLAEEKHLNPNGVLHGGAVMGFLDTVMGHAVVHYARRPCATVSMETRFMAAGRAGPFIMAVPRLRKLTKTLAFVEADAISDETLIVGASAVFRLFDAAHFEDDKRSGA